ISSLVSVAGAGSLAVNLPISATLAGTNVGSAKLAVNLSGDVFGSYNVGVDFQAAAPDVAQAFKDFTNITPGDVLGSISELANNFQALAQQFALPADIPFVESKISDAIDFATRVRDLASALSDLGLQGSIEVALGALTGPANFSVVVNGVSKAV